MNSGTYRENLRARRIKQVKRRKRQLAYGTMLILIMVMLTFGGILSMANTRPDESADGAYYKSISIRQGDSLWSIAGEYSDNCGMDIREYVKEIKRLNSLTSETIHTGEYLIVLCHD